MIRIAESSATEVVQEHDVVEVRQVAGGPKFDLQSM
jgi:hypothetical protein